jgi:hypothetical protein
MLGCWSNGNTHPTLHYSKIRGARTSVRLQSAAMFARQGARDGEHAANRILLRTEVRAPPKRRSEPRYLGCYVV